MKLLVVEDDVLMHGVLKNIFKDLSLSIATSQAEAEELLEKEVFSVAFLDINLKKGTEGDGIELLKLIRQKDAYLPCVMISGLSDKNTIMKCFELGAVDYVVKGTGSAETYRLALHKSLMWRKLFSESKWGRLPTRNLVPDSAPDMKGKSQALSDLKDIISKVGKLPGPFLILGETGVGKELTARAVWSQMKNPTRPFIALNCASLPENLVESELFGYERGAFTGALTARAGLFEAANGGDIFLDEIGELTVDLQAKLLRVLQEKRVRRLGSDRERPVDFRIIAATNVELLSAVKDGDFREDLFYRVNVHQLRVPALRERKEDILELFHIFLEELGFQDIQIEPSAQDMILSFNWPGNIRQLKSLSQYSIPYIDRATGTLRSDTVATWLKLNRIPGRDDENLNALDPMAELQAALSEKRSLDLVSKLDSLQKTYVQSALKLTQNNRSQAAKILGVSRQRLSNWLSEWGSL